MGRVFIGLVFCAFMPVLPIAGQVPAPQKIELERAHPFAVRDGLANSARKLEAGRAFTVAFLGGSITEKPAGFASQFPEWLGRQFPKAQIRAINAGWGGTDSELGARRIDREVLSQKPDLLFVEFAVNDSANPQVAPMERIVRKTWEANPETDIVFLYTMGKLDPDFFRKGKLPPAPSVHDRVAAHYGIPSIVLGYEIAQRINAGEIRWEDFSNDVCHPHEGGYRMFLKAMTTATKAAFAAGKVGPHAMPAPMTPGLVVHPPRIPPEPMPKPAPMLDSQGAAAAETWELPVLGTQWTGSAEFPTGDGARWKLLQRPMSYSKVLDATAGLDRSKWSDSVEWLEEAGFFVSSDVRWLAGGRDERAGDFGANGRYMAVLTFRAPRDGRYRVTFGANGAAGYSMAEKKVALNVVHFPADAQQGTSIAFHSASKADFKRFDETCEVAMKTGDEIAFVFLVKDIGGGAFYQDLRAKFGRWDLSQ